MGIGLVGLQAQTPAAWISQLTDSNVTDTVRWQAALELGRWTAWQSAGERRQAVEALRDALRSREVGLRVNAATALGWLGDPEAVPALGAALRDRNSLVRQAAARALGRVGTPEASLALLAGLDDPDLRVRIQTIRALGATGQPMAAEPLAQLLLRTEEGGLLAQEAADALVRLGGFALDPLLRVAQRLRPATRRLVAQVLGRIGDPRAVEPLIAWLADPDPQVAAQAANALAQLGEPALTPLLEQLRHPDSRVRRAAALALAGIGEPAVAPLQGNYNRVNALLTQLQDELRQAQLAEEQRLRGAPAAPPGPTGPPAAPQPVPATFAQLQRELKTLEKDLKRLNKEREATEQLALYRWAEQEFQRRIAHAQEMAATPPQTPVLLNPYLVSLTPAAVPPSEQRIDLAPLPPEPGSPYRPSAQIQREIESVRETMYWILRALGALGTDTAVQALADVLQNGQLPEATVAAAALGETRNRNALPILQQVAQDTNYPTSVRANAVRSLGVLGDPSVRSLLEDLWQNDPAPNVRRAAREALDRLGPLATAP